MLIDTHTHISDLAAVDKIILSGASIQTDGNINGLQRVFEIAQSDARIFCTLGLHPDEYGNWFDYEPMLGNPKVVGVGEIGLDYHYFGIETRAGQIELFRRQLDIARRVKMPVAIHSRDADEDSLESLHDLPAAGVMHCFTGGWDFARRMLDRGFYISASGIITFKNADEIRETFARVPTGMILCETDSPFCAPVPFRGQDARPSMVCEVVRVLAQIKNVPALEMEKILWNNAHRLFSKLNNLS